MRRRHKNKKIITLLMIGLMVFTSFFSSDPANQAQAAEVPDGLILWYKFDDVEGRTIKDASGNENNGTLINNNYSFENWEDAKVVSLGGGNINTGAHIKLPDGFTKDLTDATISTWINLRGNESYTRIFDFGRGTSNYMYLTPTGQNQGARGLAFGITTKGWSEEEKAEKGTALTRNEWTHVAVVISGKTVTVYENGIKVAENTELTLNPSSLGDTIGNYIGRGQFTGDAIINAMYSDFRVYNRALPASEIANLLNMSDEQSVAADKEAIQLGNLRTVDNDLGLPTKGQYGSTITWESSNPAIIAANGKVTRPEPSEGDAEVTLTAMIKKGTSSDTRVFEATVLAKLSDEEKVELDKNALSLGNISSLTSDIELPLVGRNGSDIIWESSDTDVISNLGKVTRPEPKSGDAEVTLTATIRNGGASDTKVFKATVLEAPFVLALTQLEEVNVDTALGAAPELPGFVVGKYNDNVTIRQLAVTWDEIDAANYEKEGTFTVNGTVEGTEIPAVAKVTVKPLLTAFNMNQLKAGEKLEVTVQGKNTEEQALPVLVAMTLYGADGKLRDVSFANGTIESGELINLTANMQLPEDISGNKVRVFVWEGESAAATNLQPLTGVSELTDETAPVTMTPPTGLTAAPGESPEITLTWDEVAGATGYDLEVDGNVIPDVTSPYVHRNLVYGSEHTYAVRAKTAAGASAWSTSVKASATSTPSSSLAAEPFGLGDVQLHDSIFTQNRDREYKYLESLNMDTLLYSFRVTAGMDTKGAAPMTGWDGPVEKLRGHSTGHYLSAISQAYASSGDEKWKTRIDYMIDELAKIQEAMPTQENDMARTTVGKANPELIGKNNEGYLSAYPERQFILLEHGASYTGGTDATNIDGIWAPYYTLHKILAGLLDAYELAGNEEALDIAVNVADWVNGRLSALTQDELDAMWKKYIAGEYGGMNEVLAKLYAITGNQKYLDTAKMFDNANLFPSISANEDTLDGLHANQHIPQITGALTIFDQTNEKYYFDVANNFWDMVVNHRTFSNGGTGQGEHFRGRDEIAEHLGSGTAENCATYNMLKLTRQLFFHSPDAKFMDYYEKALYNGIISSQDQSEANRGVVYFMPLGPGLRKNFGRSSFTCCAGTGLESQTKYQDSIYFHSADDNSLYVNMYMPSTLDWKEKGFTIDQQTNFPVEQGSTITVNGDGELDIKLRVPSWAVKGFEVKVNGVEQDINAQPSTYVSINRKWTAGDKIEISYPYSFRVETAPDDPTIGSVFYGPLLMVGKDDRETFLTLDINKQNPDLSFDETENPLHFTNSGITLVPMYEAYNFAYHAYFKINE